MRQLLLYYDQDLGSTNIELCVCLFILDVRFVDVPPGSHRISGACINFSREKDSAIPFPRRP